MSGLYRVLVVDDEMLIRQGIINYIDWEQEGFEVVGEASNGKEALKLIEALQPHIILTDVVMPDMDGIELVREVKMQYPSIELIVLSSFENFDYVRSTFQNGVADYILKPKLNGEELIKTLRRIAPERPAGINKNQSASSVEEVLTKKMSGGSLTEAEDKLLQDLVFKSFTLIAVIGLEARDVTDQLSEVDLFLLPSDESDTTFLLLNGEEEQWPALKQSITRWALEHRDARLLVSAPFSSVHELQTVYEENLVKMKYYLFYLEDPVLCYDSLPEVERTTKPFDLSRFIDFFKQKRFELAIPSLKEHVDFLTRNYTNDIFEFKSFLENIIFNSVVLLGNMNYDVEELEGKKYDYFTVINEAGTAKTAVASFHDFMDEVEKIIQVEDRPSNMQRLLEYIDVHYAEPLSLTTLADYFHFNPSYLSSYFSNHHNVGFSDYLNHVRIEKAKHMLASSAASVSEISDMVGYSEPSYFCKVFKRLEGSSPGRYRKKSPVVN
ncbi:response regulator transcription factor [Thalassobacillus pellis]|uniref:response regulator transcription factor n=1 Tax=Thalassobacillus pellis TaxID=748008 RepID=UPI001960D55E|nr:response regulator transcription factor [Thalassobacillus pellis]MBM7553886.1 two-component system response regulator YesN [Thalassobacillus pellis]